MKETILKRILKVLIVICILLVYLSLMMSDIVTYASSDTGEENVIFEAYFENENGERINQIEKSINSEDIRLHIKVEVKNEVIVPEIIGKTVKEAEKILKENNLELVLNTSEEINKEEYIIKEQTPQSGIKVYEGNKIYAN